MKRFLHILSLIPLITFGQTKNYDNVITVVVYSNKDVDPEWIQLNMSANENKRCDCRVNVRQMTG